MPVQLNHTIVWCRDKKRSAAFLSELLQRPEPTAFGPFLVVELDNDVSLDFYERDGAISLQHYAFLISEEEFDRAFEKVRSRGLSYWADPAKSRPGEVDTHDGGRRIYFDDPDNHLLEIMTRKYGVASVDFVR
jgi:catechol 2,3-dioxygenase-like lactoylglutathione lyase family enzyme